MTGAYTKIIDELLPVIGADAAVIVGKVIAFSGEQGECSMSLQYLADLFGTSTDTIRRHVKRLNALGYIVYKEGRGKGNCSTFQKGAKLLPYEPSKRVQNCAQKVADLQPINNNKNNMVSTTAHTRVTDQQKKRSFNMEDFNLFWNGFAPRKEYQAERERCEEKWRYMPQEMRTAIINELRQGIKRKNRSGFYYKSPYLYLNDFTMPLPIWYNGTAEAGYAMDEAKKGGYTLVAFRMPDRRIAYCKPQDVEQVRQAGGRAI